MTLRPLRALRPTEESVEAVASVPYDVVTVAEARALAAGNPLSFLHVVRPEIDLPLGTGEHDDAVYAQGAQNLREFRTGSHSVVEDEAAFYVYRLAIGGHTQTGVFGCVSAEEYDAGLIVRHENTRPAKVADRVRHIRAQGAHAEPVILTYKRAPDIAGQVEQVKQTARLYDFVAPDGVRHTVWRAPGSLEEAFRSVRRFYIADGHHRCEAASRASEGGESAWFPAVLFPMDDLRILPYNRIVRKRISAPLIEAIEKTCGSVVEAASATPERKGDMCVFADGTWHLIRLPATRRHTVADTLDVARLSEFVLEPVFGIMDQRTDPHVSFVGGVRGTQALEVEGGATSFSLFATSIDELVAVSDAGLLMPPKSTWFEPKLRSGILVHTFAG